MKKIDFYGQMVLIIVGLLLAIPFTEMSILFAGLAMLVVGVWQLLSTIFNMLNTSTVQKIFYRQNLYIAVGYIITAIILWETIGAITNRKIQNTTWYIMMGIPPLLIFRYWIGIGKIYNIGFLKKKINNEQQ